MSRGNFVKPIRYNFGNIFEPFRPLLDNFGNIFGSFFYNFCKKLKPLSELQKTIQIIFRQSSIREI